MKSSFARKNERRCSHFWQAAVVSLSVDFFSLLRSMIVLRFFITVIQALLIFPFTAFSGLLAIILRLFLPPNKVVFFISHQFWSTPVLLISGVRLSIIGRQHISKKKAYIYVANHESQMDIAVIVRSVTVPLFFVAKKELAKVPVLGWYIRAMSMIFIDRKNREKAMESMRKASLRIKSGMNVITFPEGTRSKSNELLPFKKGTFIIAKEGQIGIIPIAIEGTREVLPSRAFIMRPGKVSVTIGQPIEPHEFESLSAEQLSEMVRERIKKMISHA